MIIINTNNYTEVEYKLNKQQRNLTVYRIIFGYLGLVSWFISILAFDWDEQWHLNVGRDGFWTPPHWLFYSSVTLCGLICAVDVLTETYLYYRRRNIVNEKNSVAVLFFRGGHGFILTGFGLLVMLLSAPLDDYWHRIYGIDVQIWSPFHVMLILGMLLASLGFIYVFAPMLKPAKIKIELRIKNIQMDLVLFGLLLSFIALLSRYLLLMSEVVVGAGTFDFFGSQLPAYSLVIAPISLLLVTLVNITHCKYIATSFGLAFFLFRGTDYFFITWAVKALANGRNLRLTPLNNFVVIIVTYPIFLPLIGLMVDIIYLIYNRKSRNSNKNRFIAVLASVGASLMLYLLEKPWETYNNVLKTLALQNPLFAKSILAQLFKPDYWQALPLIVLIGAMAGIVGLFFSTLLKYAEN